MNITKQTLLLLLTGCICLNSCGQQVQRAKRVDSVGRAWDKTIPGSFSAQTTAIFDSIQLAVFLERYPGFRPYKVEITRFYAARHFAYAWFDKRILIEQAGNLANRIRNMKNDGIYKILPYQDKLDSLLQGTADKKPDTELELMLTAQYFCFSKLAWDGMNTAESTAANWYVPRKKVAYGRYLDSILKITAGTPADEPVYRQYRLLRTYLGKYRALDAQGNWAPVVNRRVLKPGDSSSVISIIKSRLFRLEDYHGDTLNRTYTDELVASVKQFQDRNGLQENGLLDKMTLAALNVPLKTRIKQLLVNLERSRWLPVRLGGDYLAVNIPEFQLHVYHADSLLWSCSVVVGQTVHPTTVFYGEVSQVVFSPYWNIPQSIVRNEVLPGIKKAPDYLARHRMEITGHVDGLPVVRQLPGPENSLGLVKFLFPNSYNIYLHDTPSKSLFVEPARAFSHGCIRVMEPAELAAFLLSDTVSWNPQHILAAMHAGKERVIILKDKVPVFIAYFTAFTDRKGRLNFRKDIYNLDNSLAATILSGRGEY